ncbi:MAG: hypothetical protein ACKOSO_10245, partial [Actinomycetota bacterium]
MAKRWTCVEAGCDEEIVAPDVETAVELVQRHIAEATTATTRRRPDWTTAHSTVRILRHGPQ